jgi:hypothetical protein
MKQAETLPAQHRGDIHHCEQSDNFTTIGVWKGRETEKLGYLSPKLPNCSSVSATWNISALPPLFKLLMVI